MSASPYQTILFEIAGGVARLTLNRPEKLNSFTVAMHAEVHAALEVIRRDTNVRVLLLTGTGRAFCAGQDLNDRAVAPGSTPADLGDSIEKYYGPLIKSLRALPLPVVCAVNGIAAGAGANLAFCCDLVIATKSAGFLEPFCKLGLIPDTGGTYMLPRLAGPARALGLAMLGEKITAEQAAAWGLIWKCIEDAEFSQTIETIVGQLANGPTLGYARIKQAIQASAHNSFDQQVDLERDFMRELGRSADYREGVAAFLAKRPPQFQGK
jgi:2-(1,2-epoxy-1,2-dihydrophenyl)acetyl-CoA isomerase